jgi:hypothetical protein
MRASQLARLWRLEQQCPERAWLQGEGLAALLQYARRRQYGPLVPDKGLWPESGEATGLARLLREARQEHRQ